MKKSAITTLFSVLLVLLLAFALAGCSDTNNGDAPEQTEVDPVEEYEEVPYDVEEEEDNSAAEILPLLATLEPDGVYSLADMEALFGMEGVYRPSNSRSFRMYDLTFDWGRIVVSVRDTNDQAERVSVQPRSNHWFVQEELSFPSDFRQIFDNASGAEMTHEWATDLFGGEPHYSDWRYGSGFEDPVWSDGTWWFRIGGTTVQAGQ